MDSRNIDELLPNARNPRTMSKHDADALKKSIQEFGDLSGIVFNTTTGQLVGGHQRIETFKRMAGSKQVVITKRFDQPNTVGTVAVGYITYGDEYYGYREVQWDEAREVAANIAANRIQGEFDLDLLAELDWWLKENNPDMLALTGQTDDEISRLLDATGPSEATEDEPPAIDEVNPPMSKLGEVYQLGRHRLMCGSSDNLEQVNTLMAGQYADLVLTDPPYGYSYESNHSDKHEMLMNDDTFVDFMPSALVISKPNCAYYIFGSWQTVAEWIGIVKAAGIELKNIIIWKKNNWIMGDLKSAYAGQYEIILFAIKGNVELRQGRDRDVWEFDREPPVDHPTMKPIDLLTKAIKQSSDRGETVVDFFGGSGSTLIACEQTDRTCYMMELDPKYCDVIRKRYANHVGQGDQWREVTPPIDSMPVAGMPEVPVSPLVTDTVSQG